MGENGGVWWCVGGTIVSGISRSTSWCKKVRWPESFPTMVAGFCWCPAMGGGRKNQEREREFVRCVCFI